MFRSFILCDLLFTWCSSAPTHQPCTVFFRDGLVEILKMATLILLSIHPYLPLPSRASPPVRTLGARGVARFILCFRAQAFARLQSPQRISTWGRQIVAVKLRRNLDPDLRDFELFLLLKMKLIVSKIKLLIGIWK